MEEHSIWHAVSNVFVANLIHAIASCSETSQCLSSTCEMEFSYTNILFFLTRKATNL
jgi:hypothetical protein